LCILAAVALQAHTIAAQDLEPRAYSVSPQGINFLVLGFNRSSGDVSFDPALPIEDANATLHAGVLGYVRSIDFLGRSANVGLVVPYVWGTLEGFVYDQFQSGRRSGLGDPAARFSVNLYGAPSMDREEFALYHQGFTLGASLVVSAPLGQYDSRRLVNIGDNRWSAKPEIGLSQRLGKWYLDLYLGSWFFGPNNDLQGKTRRQDPMPSAQIHVSYSFTRRLWAGFDANYYTGGRTSLNGITHADYQRNSRVGATLAFPVTKHQSAKVSISKGAVTNIGGNFTQLSVAYQYFWGGGM